nr:nuclear transport factor 2 family protein [Pedobacter sp. ASV19]
MEPDQMENSRLQVLALTRKLTRLMIDRDIAGLEEILDADFTLTHITGHVQSKADWLAEIKNEGMKYYGYEEVKTSIKIDGNKARFIGQNVLDARIWGTRSHWRLQQTVQLEKRDGTWIILRSIAALF